MIYSASEVMPFGDGGRKVKVTVRVLVKLMTIHIPSHETYSGSFMPQVTIVCRDEQLIHDCRVLLRHCFTGAFWKHIERYMESGR